METSFKMEEKMISEKDLAEVRHRDFLNRVNHYDDFKDIPTELLLGSEQTEPVFLTIIIPVYDHPWEFIRRAIDSVLRQNCTYSYRLLVIDDFAGGDATQTECFLRQQKDSRVLYYKNKENLGVFGNWNRAISLAHSTWITLLHSDDFYKDNYLQNMCDIVNSHPEIDQLACHYKKLDFLNDTIDIQKECRGHDGERIVRRVKACEYLYEMKTSVKGAFYKKEKLIEIGGFRSQGDGIGLDDWPLMLCFAHFFNTYLLEDVLYLNSWAHNDSLNTKHWYPELVENYYMWLYFADKENRFLRLIYRKAAKCLLLERARIYKSGKSWVGVPIEIDYEQLRKDCELDSVRINRLWELVSFCLVKVNGFFRKRPFEKFKVRIRTASVNTGREREDTHE